ncbi:D-alanyl-D-alanine carboxypeptidase/D-alanyl-D-alanine endopeptidase [Pedobacter insulae]|uniref:D-alanyl-D-alanine carboxypeptidase / D-alanyl-D-alanine-endopeptidase (Penicillin-binding protein 4) n=1 Tax=Pedobacter insulae TaxID=414048 RepID=A0A1I2TQJ7_9SPHI|nr:D-alanyl-D-alanine carboxypeptidase/D-alanyl-D-alanine-endopeptidase [Pedobacter insulae]SFG66449.1 D-alanyl-D-alanine carboxypeptidase / D-alanyl-D-alanine-endopeptidase (penicillin-binding protein 4) [Pedobacter insulae]
MNRFKASLLLIFLFSQTCFAQFPIVKLAQAYQDLVTDNQTKYAITSICILDANTGKIIFAKNEDKGLATASTLKTITSATAFSILGKDFQYQTTLAYSGKITLDGTLQGDLIIIGTGDPTLGSWRYEQSKENVVLTQWVNAVKAAGIQKIEGKIIGDDSLFGSQSMPEGWIWQDMGNYYGAGTSSLTWRENQFDIHLKPGATVGSSVNISKIVPAMPYIQVINELKTGPAGSGDNAYGYLPPYSSLAYLRGTWGMGIGKNGISLAVPDPAFDAAYRLQDTLKRLNIQSNHVTTTRRLNLDGSTLPAITQKLATITSPSLSEIIYWFNKKSINLYGEQLLKTIAWKSGKTPSTRGGAAAEVNFWAAKGIDKDALNILDGSGLSPGTRVTTLAMASILFQVQKEVWFSDYLNSFPENNGMKLKSGSINDVSAYAGYYTAANGNKYIAVININNYSGSGISKKLFKVLDALK